MQLKTKLILLISLILCCFQAISFYNTAKFQKQLVVDHATRQAKMLFDQIRLTRQWIADHNGLFLVKTPDMQSNPFLENGEIQDTSGTWLVKRNPAMVTRELSHYAAREGMGQFNVTSLTPLNPANIPDDFERRSLESFTLGASESVEMQSLDGKHQLRYMAPLQVEESCLECHTGQGYKAGDIRGGMTVSIPMDWAYAEIRANNLKLLIISLLSIVAVAGCLYLLFNSLVVRRLQRLAHAMTRYPDARIDETLGSCSCADEIGALKCHFRDLCSRLESSQHELDRAREQVFQGEKLAALGRLIAGVAHEINNPLGGMQNCLQIMRRHPQQQERYLELLTEGLERIKNTVRQLLDIGRKEPLVIVSADLDKVIRDCAELSCVGHRNIELDIALNIGRQVTTGIEAVRQIILNLTGNAVQAIGRQQERIAITSEICGDRIRISVSDSGPGIPAEHLDKIFEPFFTTKEIGEGTGLGLSVSHSLVERLGGSLSVSNTPTGGACFVLQFPLQPATREG